MDFKVFIGIDVSKATLDYCMVINAKKVLSAKTDNTAKGIRVMLSHLSKNTKISRDKWLFCMEQTGLYCRPTLKELSKKGIAVWVENALVIKTFHSMERGKNDAMDAYRIAVYASTKRTEAKLWEAPRPVIDRLKSLIGSRKRLIAAKRILKVPLAEEKVIGGSKDTYRGHKRVVNPAIKAIDKQIKAVEKEIRLVISDDEKIKEKMGILTSIPGIGMVVAVNTLVATNEFTNISDAKKMACHCGVAPFAYSSGTSIRGRSKVSHRAHKAMKALLHLAAMSAVKCKGEIREYYLRKVGEGKNKMLVLNAVRNKLIHRMFACIKNNREYDKSYTHQLA